jgi:chemotaxis protein MotB
MGRLLSVLVVVVVAAAVALGAFYLFVHQPKLAELEDARREASLCVQERSALKGRIQDLETMLGDLRKESAELEAAVKEKEEQLAKIQATQDEIVASLQQEIENGQIQVQRLRGQLRVDVVDEILFDSGEAALKPQGKAVLEKLAAVLADSDRLVRVQGHTDNVPIAGRLAQTYPTNWELSAARAVNVVRFLAEKGLEPQRLSASAQSEYRPRASNDTPEGRQKNRRIEILLEPAEPSDEETAANGNGNGN